MSFWREEVANAVDTIPLNPFTTGDMKHYTDCPYNSIDGGNEEDELSRELQSQARKGKLKKLGTHKSHSRGGRRQALMWEKIGVEKKMKDDKESVKVLQECIDLQLKKSQDYQNPNSNVTQAMHYRRGVDSIHDIMQGKLYRAQSLLESGGDPNYESLEDTYKDLINYASFAVSWLRGGIPGQDPDRDMLNAKRK